MNVTAAEVRVLVPGVQEALSIEYLSAGSGAPLVLLHGVGDSARTWERVLPALARTCRVYAPSFPGFGASAKPPVAYSPEFFTAVVSAFLDTLGVGRVAIVGNSLGGLVALRLVLASPARVRALMLVDSAGLGRRISWGLRLLTIPGVGKLASAWHKTAPGSWHWALALAAQLFAHPTHVPRPWLRHVREMARTPGYLEATVATIRSGASPRGQRKREILLDALPRLAIPALVVWGARDRIVPAEHARAAVTRLLQGELAILDDCGHVPQLECPDELARLVEDFLTRAEADTRKSASA